MKAATKDNADISQLLLEAGADPNLVDHVRCASRRYVTALTFCTAR